LEKMLYVVWKNEADSGEGFRQRLVEELSPQLIALGARRLRIAWLMKMSFRPRRSARRPLGRRYPD
jgi:hypothetical protein